MDHWQPSGILSSCPLEERSSHSSRVLTDTSGNLQPGALDIKEGIENRNPYEQDQPSYTGSKILPSHFLPPGPTLASNDPQAAALRLAARRQRKERRHKLRPELSRRAYLTNKKYLDYRSRQRCDINQEDGKVVWSSLVEDAFQDALVHIEPMGRRKKSQHGKPNGRNELIAEWIYRATGERRTRKQVSSHIQVLNGLLRGIPEWDALIKTTEDCNGQGKGDNEYFDNSIALKVQQTYHESYLGSGTHGNLSNSAKLPPPAYTLGSNSILPNCHQVAGLNFEMWISPDPSQTSHSLQCLHNYTRLQSSHSSSDPSPLENIKGWRQTFPRLPAILDSAQHGTTYDIIFLEASFKLLSDFPPRRAQLGISLELDFNRWSSGNGTALGGLGQWTCTTHMYQHGQLINAPTQKDCQEINDGKIKPAFESNWWANAFIRLTEKQRRAEETRDDVAIQAAREESRGFFRSLSIIQELRTFGDKKPYMNSIYHDQGVSQPATILLWKFSQAQTNYVGTTTWQKLIPPPDRMAAQSPQPSAEELALPPLTMDTVVGQINSTSSLGHHEHWLAPDHQQQYHSFDGSMEAHVNFMGQDNFDLAFKDEDIAGFADIHTSFDLRTTHQDHTNLSFHDLNHINIGTQPRTVDMNHHVSDRVTSNNLFETEHLAAEAGPRPAPDNYPHNAVFACDADGETHRRPLINFDHNTHRMLQAQLADPSDQHHHDADEALREALVAASVMNDLGTTDHTVSVNKQMQAQERSGYWETPPATRPVLQSHPSYISHHSQHASMPGTTEDHANTDTFNASHLATLLNGPDAVYTQSTTAGAGSGSQSEPPDHGNLFVAGSHDFSIGADAHLGRGLGGSFVDVKLEELDS